MKFASYRLSVKNCSFVYLQTHFDILISTYNVTFLMCTALLTCLRALALFYTVTVTVVGNTT